MKKVVAMHLLAVLLLASTWGLAEALEGLVTYDTFEMGPISPDRWIGASLGPDLFTSQGNLYEQNRSIIVDPSGVGRDLRVLNRSYGLTNSDVGIALGVYGLEFENPGPVTAIRARMQVLSAVSKGCLTNFSSPTIAQARLVGFFFNGATPSIGLTDAVFAQVVVQRRSNSTDPANVFEVIGGVLQCVDPDCIDVNPIGVPSNIVPLGKVTAGQWVKGLVQWDPANDKFIFQRDNQAQKIVSYAGVSDTDPPAVPIKGLGVSNIVANCTSAPRPFASMNALFDNVAVNQNALLPQ